MYHLFAVKMVGYKKKQKKEAMQALCRLPPTATGGRQRSHVATTCASWQLTHLVSLPTVADGKGLMLFAVSGGRQRLPLAA